MIFSILSHLLPLLAGSSNDFKELGKGVVAVGERESVRAPCVAIRINLVRLYKLFADLKSVAPSNPNHLIRNARIRTAVPCLLINGNITFSSDPLKGGTLAPKFFCQSP